MKTAKSLFIFLVIVSILIACSPTPPQGTATASPTETPAPTATMTPIPTATVLAFDKRIVFDYPSVVYPEDDLIQIVQIGISAPDHPGKYLIASYVCNLSKKATSLVNSGQLTMSEFDALPADENDMVCCDLVGTYLSTVSPNLWNMIYRRLGSMLSSIGTLIFTDDISGYDFYTEDLIPYSEKVLSGAEPGGTQPSGYDAFPVSEDPFANSPPILVYTEQGEPLTPADVLK